VVVLLALLGLGDRDIVLLWLVLGLGDSDIVLLWLVLGLGDSDNLLLVLGLGDGGRHPLGFVLGAGDRVGDGGRFPLGDVLGVGGSLSVFLGLGLGLGGVLGNVHLGRLGDCLVLGWAVVVATRVGLRRTLDELGGRVRSRDGGGHGLEDQEGENAGERELHVYEGCVDIN